VEKRSQPAFTLQKSVTRTGVGLFTGEEIVLTLTPLPLGSGIVIERSDLERKPSFRVHSSLVQGTPRCTIVGTNVCAVQTVEHLMAALHAHQISDLLIRVHGPEIPIFDGSSCAFMAMLQEAGLVQQGEKIVHVLNEPLFWSQGDVHLIALPSIEFRWSYTLHYPHHTCIGTQFYSVACQDLQELSSVFNENISPARTFSVYEEVLPLIEKGQLRGGTLDNAVVIRDNIVVNPEGLRFADEMVRHKILDLMGDLYLMEFYVQAHIIAMRSGHAANNALAKEFVTHFMREM